MKPAPDRLVLDVEGLNGFLRGAFPQADAASLGEVIEARPGFLRLAFTPGEQRLRPGGLVSGPTQMALADTAAYALVAAHIGPVEMAVTSSLNMQFLRPCQPRAIHADAHLLRLGRRLVIMDVRLWTDEEAKPVSQAIVTYALP